MINSFDMSIRSVSLPAFEQLLLDTNCDAVQYWLEDDCRFARLYLGFKSKICLFVPVYQTLPVRNFRRLVKLQLLAESYGKILVPRVLSEPDLSC